MTDKSFYKYFEAKHRGNRELVKSRLEQYLPFILTMKILDSKSNALDLGCGRGEWLELLVENGWEAKGVDLDEQMLQLSRMRGFNVAQKDAIKALQELSSDSCNIVSGFHIAEHLSFDALQQLMQESLRVLKPGGLLILETPNPENIKVATEYFYLDPTHVRPIPQELLFFMSQYYGFKRTEVFRLQESKELYDAQAITLSHVLEGVSPDYAIVAQKEACEEFLSHFDTLFAKDIGLSFHALASKFEIRLRDAQALIDEANIKAQQALSQADEANIKAQQALNYVLKITNKFEIRLRDAQALIDEANIKAQQALSQADEANIKAQQALNYVLKITKPIRLMIKAVRWFIAKIKALPTLPKTVMKTTLVALKNYINQKPKLKVNIIRILKYFPSLQVKLKRITHYQHKLPDYQINEEYLAPKISEIYQNLKTVINKKRQKIK